MTSIKPFSKMQAPKNAKQQVNVYSDNRQKAIFKETSSEKHLQRNMR